ncbi:MAG: ECF transporter S component [Candidatus Bathyarchaeia archaeon]|jgi:riboflavin transporter FmnP
MNSKEVALCSIFTAIAIALSQIRIPTITGLPSFYFWEIPIVIAALLYGFKLGVLVAALSAIGQTLIFPRALGFLFPLWNFSIMLTTLIGLFLAYSLLKWKISKKEQVAPLKVNSVIYYTALALILRLALSPFINYFMYKFMMPIITGQMFSDITIIALMPILLAFDTILTIYTIPTGYLISKMVNNNLKIGNQFL